MIEFFIEPLQALLTQAIAFIPKLIGAWLIWIIGKYIINLVAKMISKIDFKGDIDDKIVALINSVVVPVLKFLLVLVILDTFGIGETIISALLSALSFAIAITIGLAFGDALKPQAKAAVKKLEKALK